MTVPSPEGLDLASLPEANVISARTNVLVVSSVALSFISFWRAAAIVLCDLASSAYYIGGISEQAVGKAAPWFILGVMLFSYAVRAVYVESCTMFTRGGVYRVVKEAMGGTLAKLSVSALMFDYILTGPISAVSAGQYLCGLLANLWNLIPGHAAFDASTHPQTIQLLSAGIAVAITLYFWRANLIGIGESSDKAMKIVKLTTVMGVIIIIWSGLTLWVNRHSLHLPPWRPVLTGESSGWLVHWPKLLGGLGIIIAFGHSLLAMSGEESLAQVNRELEAPKLRNLQRTGMVIFLYSLLLTGLVSFFAVLIIPDQQRISTAFVTEGQRTSVDYVDIVDGQRFGVIGEQRLAIPQDAEIVRESAKYTDNLISGLAMNMIGPAGLKIALQAFVVLVGFLILSGAVNTSMVGSNGVLNRLAEDGVLTPGFLKPHPRYGTTNRLINMVAILQLITIVASMGDVYTLGEAYAFGVVWSFVFKTLAMVVLRFKDHSHRQYKVPLNVGVGKGEDRIELPIGISMIFLILLATAMLNLATKKTATIWGCGFTAGFLTVFVTCEILSHRRRGGGHHEHLEQFNETQSDTITPLSVGITHKNPILVAARGPRSLPVLEQVLRSTDTEQRDVVVLTCKVLPPRLQGITDEERSLDEVDRQLLTRIVSVAEEVGKRVYPVVVPTNNPLHAICSTARALSSNRIVLGVSEKMQADTQLEQFAIAWGATDPNPSQTEPVTIQVIGPGVDVKYEME